MKIIKLIIIPLLIIMLSGCCKDTIILQPNKTYYSTFNTSEFKTRTKYNIEVQPYKENSLIIEKDQLLGLVKYTKDLRSDYNTLLNKLRLYNKRIKKLNKEIKEQKPVVLKD